MAEVRIAVLGAVRAGKTRFVHAGMLALERSFRDAGRTFAPADPDSAAELTRAADTILSHGNTIKTEPDGPPTAISVRVGTASSTGLLHVFDPAGELLRERESNSSLRFLDDAHGIVLIIDPFSIARVRHVLTGRLPGAAIGGLPASDDPEDSYQVTAQRLRDSGVRLERRSLAMTVVKADLLLENLQEGEIDSRSSSIRSWLIEQGMDNLVLAAERDFGGVRYFLVSSLTGWRPRHPLTAAAPLLWLAGRAGLDTPVGDSRVSS